MYHLGFIPFNPTKGQILKCPSWILSFLKAGVAHESQMVFVASLMNPSSSERGTLRCTKNLIFMWALTACWSGPCREDLWPIACKKWSTPYKPGCCTQGGSSYAIVRLVRVQYIKESENLCHCSPLRLWSTFFSMKLLESHIRINGRRGLLW